MGRRTYIPTLIQITARLCQVILLATPIIQTVYSGNVALLAALEAANLACAELNEQARLVRDFGD